MKATRRDVIAAAGALPTAAVPIVRTNAPSEVLSISLLVNGEERHAEIDPRTSLLDLLREHLRLTGTKKGCDHGQCGACTVLLDGRRMLSCLSLAAMHDGDAITTIEGLGSPGRMHPMQNAFLRNDGLQCGFCTPGQICSAIAMLGEVAAGWPSQNSTEIAGRPILDDAEIRERMSGNLCRCAAYPNIVKAIREVASGR